MNVLSLFDGMSCGRIALERAGVPVTNYYASEIDKYAIKVSQANWPDIIRLGDVENWRYWNIDWASIDLILGGSPCQGFSYAGDKLAFDDPRSKLFFTYVDILNHIKRFNPAVKFMLENVKMKKEFLDVISDSIGASPLLLNSDFVSAQSRERYYWCNWSVTKPIIKDILLKDILEISFDSKYFFSDKMMAGFDKRKKAYEKRGAGFGHNIADINGKSKTLLARYYKDGKECIIKVADKFRKLTPVECERLQTVPDNYTVAVSDTQRYKMLGNGWTVDVIAHIFSNLREKHTNY